MLFIKKHSTFDVFERWNYQEI